MGDMANGSPSWGRHPLAELQCCWIRATLGRKQTRRLPHGQCRWPGTALASVAAGAGSKAACEGSMAALHSQLLHGQCRWLGTALASVAAGVGSKAACEGSMAAFAESMAALPYSGLRACTPTNHHQGAIVVARCREPCGQAKETGSGRLEAWRRQCWRRQDTTPRPTVEAKGGLRYKASTA